MKETIKTNFNKSFLTYDKFCTIQNKINRKTIELLLRHVSNFDNVADFACGTGESTLRLINSIQYNKCFAVDFSERLLAIAMHKLASNVSCLLADFDEVRFDENSLSLVYCNMGLQWSLDILKTLLLFNKYLISQGYIVFSLPIDDNFPELKSSFKLNVPQHQAIEVSLKSANFELLEFSHVQFVESFSTPYAALRSIKNVGAISSIKNSNHRESGLSKSYVNNMFINSELPQLTYKIGIYLARKP